MDHPGLQSAYCPWQVIHIGKGRAGHFQRNPGGERQGAGYGQQNSPRAEVQSGGKLKEFLASLIAATDEYRYGQRQSFPISTLFCHSPAGHAFPWLLD